MSQAYYHATIGSFLETTNEEIIGRLNLGATAFSSQWTITSISWDSSIFILKNSLGELVKENATTKNWHILFEYEIPRLLSRIDVVIIADDVLFVIEFKFDRRDYELADLRQVEDYALDLSDFHYESRNIKIIPILLAPKAANFNNENVVAESSGIARCLKVNENNLSSIIQSTYTTNHVSSAKIIEVDKWIDSVYKPTPTIIQAAKALFSGQKVENISRHGAEEINLSKTTNYIIDVINKTKRDNKKTICFVTGVPGAGKTLVGLNLVHEKKVFGGEEIDTAYFSGNGPLIKVLREALARDDYNRRKESYELGDKNERPKKADSERRIKSKIQNLHSFIKDGIRQETAPTEKIVIFDEAQRCWNADHFFNQSKRNQNRETNPFELQRKSEAELLLEFMQRHDDWSVIIALVGGGQEINTGEAGIGEWGRAIAEKFRNWEIHVSPKLLNENDKSGLQQLFTSIPIGIKIYENEDLHLHVSQRSFKASNLNDWVNAMLANNTTDAIELYQIIKQTYPIRITRDIEKAKEWLRSLVIGTKRIGLVASSGGARLRPYSINVKEAIDEAYWFLNDERDIRSSYYLEMVATEFAVQGLELDFIGVCWDADLRRNNKEWEYKNFVGDKWQNISIENGVDRQYLLNKYRVLLTRAREGMVIFLPEGDIKDPTRLPEFYDPIYEYLKACGVEDL